LKAGILTVSDRSSRGEREDASGPALRRWLSVEMEAMTAASVAALTVYDMCKGMDRGITIREVALLHKEGGKSGTYRRKGKP